MQVDAPDAFYPGCAGEVAVTVSIDLYMCGLRVEVGFRVRVSVSANWSCTFYC